MTDRQREILQGALDDDPGQRCGGCGDTRVDDWHIARRGPWLTHGAEAKRCRVPCAPHAKTGALCDHGDCKELRAKLAPPRSVRSKLDEVLGL